MQEKYFITMAIPYASQKPHIGNSYEGVLTDAISRYNKQLGKDVFFLTGIDSHGQKIEEAAKLAGVDPLKYTDDITKYIEHVWDILDVRYDKIIKTTEKYHVEAVQKIFKVLFEKGDIYKGIYTGWYCVPDESFFTESQVVDGKCPDCGRKVEKADEESYFLSLSKYQKQLEDHLLKNPDFVVPHSRKNEIFNNFIRPGLLDLAVTRTSFSWGIHLPFDEKHVIYVWIDALANYITALGYTPDDIDSELFKNLWPADLQVVGKDVLRFHMIYWPVMLMALGLPLPKKILSHPWLLINSEDNENADGHRSKEGAKMSKSIGNVIYAEDFVKYFGTDATRYYILAAIPFANDSAISYRDMITKYNSDLANTIGNLVNRTITMQQKYFSGVVQEKIDINNEFDNKLYNLRRDKINSYKKFMDQLHLSEAIKHIMELARGCNKYIDETMPWVLANEESQQSRLGSVLYNLLENIRAVAILLEAIIPSTSKEILRQINISKEFSTLQSLDNESGVVVGALVNDPKPIFARIDERKKIEEINNDILSKTISILPEKENSKEGLITFDDFLKTKLIAAEIIKVEIIENSDKLLKLQLDDGSGVVKQVVSGIAQKYTDADLTGRKVVFVSNLQPVKLRGVESNGMILAASHKNIISVIFLDKDVENGWEIS